MKRTRDPRIAKAVDRIPEMVDIGKEIDHDDRQYQDIILVGKKWSFLGGMDQNGTTCIIDTHSIDENDVAEVANHLQCIKFSTAYFEQCRVIKCSDVYISKKHLELYRLWKQMEGCVSLYEFMKAK